MTSQGNHIGTLIKPHGFQGELILKGNSENLKKLEKGTPLFIDINKQRVPFFIEDVSLDPTSDKCVLKLEFINSDIEARKFVSMHVYAEFTQTDAKPEDDLSSLVSYLVEDKRTQQEYRVSDYYDHSNNPLLVLTADGNEVLLPANADYILSIDHDKKVIVVEFPEGLLE